jgi:hypothetical protein
MELPGFEFEAGTGQAAVDQVGPVLDLLQLALDDGELRQLRGQVDVEIIPVLCPGWSRSGQARCLFGRLSAQDRPHVSTTVVSTALAIDISIGDLTFRSRAGESDRDGLTRLTWVPSTCRQPIILDMITM